MKSTNVVLAVPVRTTRVMGVIGSRRNDRHCGEWSLLRATQMSNYASAATETEINK
jgi:hypothetical protein